LFLWRRLCLTPPTNLTVAVCWMPARASKSPPKMRPQRSPDKTAASEATAPAVDAPAAADQARVAALQAKVQKRSEELAQAREALGLLSKPVQTIVIFFAALSSFITETALLLVTTRSMVMFVYPLLAAYAATRVWVPDLYAAPTACSGSSTSSGPLYMPQLLLYDAMWWLVLGILSSIGFGSGLHSGIMFLWPFVMRVVMEAEAQESTCFWAIYNHPCLFQGWGGSSDGGSSNGTMTFFNQLILVWPSVIIWGAGTAIGELPPYFVTRAARRAGRTDEAFEQELEEAKSKKDLISRIKVWTIDFTERNGFLGIFLLASWPNAAFDMCGMACGWLEMPFWTFFGATLLGKSLVKTTCQSCFCIAVFSKEFFKVLLGIFEWIDFLKMGLVTKAYDARQLVMYKFQLQARITAAELMKKKESLDLEAIAQKYCDTPAHEPFCGKFSNGSFSHSARYEDAKKIAARILKQWDSGDKPDGKLMAYELSQALSKADGKLSLASLDPGSGSIFSPANLWNGFIVCLVLFFVLSIVDQVAKARQAEKDQAELQQLEQKLLKTS